MREEEGLNYFKGDNRCGIAISFCDMTHSFNYVCYYRKAIKFYIQDLCYQPDRLDSWAGMALARMSRLDVKLSAVSQQCSLMCLVLLVIETLPTGNWSDMNYLNL